MTRRLRAEITQLSIVSGAQQGDAGNTAQVASSSIIPSRTGRGNLYLLVQLSGEPLGKYELHRELIAILGEEYSRVAGGVTNGLRQAIKAANDFLYQKNLEALPLWQRVGETCCAVLRGTDLYMGIAGEAQIYVMQGNQAIVFPPAGTRYSSDASDAERRFPTPLGVRESLGRVALFHYIVEEDTRIILASGEMSKLASPDRLARAGRAGAEHLANTLGSLASNTDLSALIIDIQPAERSAVRKPRTAETGRPVVFGKPAPSKIRHQRRPTPGVPVRGIAGGFLVLILALGARILSFFAEVTRKIHAFSSWLVTSGVLGAVGRALKRGSVALLQGLGTLTQRMLPEPQPATTTAETTHVRGMKRVTKTRKSSRLPLLIVLAVLGIVAAASASVVMRSRSVSAQFSELMLQAQAAQAQAATSGNTQAAKDELARAEELAGQALQIRPADPEATTLLHEVHLAMDEASEVLRLELTARLPLGEVMGEPARLLMHENNVYVLDRGGPGLYAHPLDQSGGIQEGRLLLGPGTQVLGLTVQELTDLVWVEPSSGRETANLLVLVNGSSLVQVDSQGEATAVSVAGTDMWDDPRFVDTYSGYLYVLDAAEDRVLKYAPTGSTYDAEPMDYFQEEPPDLAGARDMAIDGYIFILAGNSILRFSGGFQEAFSISGLGGQELIDPVAIFTSPDTQYLYVADAASRRIVQLTKDGEFVRQFMPPREDETAFEGLRDLWVDEAGGRILALTADGLFLAPFHQPPATIG